MTGRLLARGEPPHYCDAPGWRHRRRLGILPGAIWACDCGSQWIWAQDGWDRGMYWSRHYPKPLQPPRPSPTLTDRKS